MTIVWAVMQSLEPISTHTLTWSVTTATNTQFPKQSISTHTLTWSVTVCQYLFSLYYHYFNSHAHVERDHRNEYPIPEAINFNSHAHVERDSPFSVAAAISFISTHTLTWSVTKSDCARYSSLPFQLTRSRGA